jgi:hypothetical protein
VPKCQCKAQTQGIWSRPGTLTSSTNADDAESRVHVFAEALPEDVAKVRRVVVE